ncbi:universal stress protein [Selenihalanaerobacter shriftii]|uniref:Nucleotide-binding universal stress protein, UspA family n=1 Tax=Selenihalanaerobacter shriftii TaxID=142842 RepID=A0A1T4JQ44_9FIRM|nr:universal stress protein [Selenihalanaerobacter shriftii]SJZ32296.1 Nucleotide-binding universal stress protein, UspA family [Selenihalanaerobacter shriftii]
MVDHTAEELTNEDITMVDLNINKILLATDGSNYSIKATKSAVSLAKIFDAEIDAVFVDTGRQKAQLPEENLSDKVTLGIDPTEAGLTAAKKFGDENNVKINTKVLRGGVTKQIVKYSKNNKIDLIVLGESGRTGLKRIALGSVALSVTKAADVPVYVAK